METSEIYKVKTTRGELQYKFVCECEDIIRMINPQTIKTYRAIKDAHPDSDALGVFFAFSDQQLKAGVEDLIKRGFIKSEDELRSGGAGCFGSTASLKKFFAAYKNKDEQIKEQCDPQEVYFYEHWNHESSISWEGDTEALKIIIDIWGVETAKKIKRYNAAYSIEHIAKED